MRNVSRTSAGVAAIAVLGLLAGCGGSSPTPAASPSAPASGATSAAPSTSPSAATETAIKENDPAATATLSKYVLRDSDLVGSRFTKDGSVTQEARFSGTGKTFDYCGAAEPSLSRRVARYASSVDGSVSGRSVSLAEEIVQFEDAASAGDALSDFKAAVKDCDGAKHQSVLADSGQLRFVPGADQSDAVGLMKPNYLEVSQLVGDESSAYLSTLIVQQGRYLTIGYILSKEEPGEPEGYSLGFVTVRVAERVGDLPT